MAMKNYVGEWMNEERDIQEFIRNGFNKIYMTSLSSASRATPNCSQWQPRLSKEERDSISGNASEEEVKAALWSLKVFNAPGPDGLHVGFF